MAGEVRVLFVSLTNDIGSDRIVSALGLEGADCAVLGRKGCYASLPRSVTQRFGLPHQLRGWWGLLVLRGRLASAVRNWAPTHVIPLDELAALVLRTRALDLSTPLNLRVLLTRAFGAPDGYRAACHRVALMECAVGAGVPTPRFAAAGAHAGLRYPLVIKRDHSSGSGGVVVARNETECGAALRRAALKNRLKVFMAWSAGYNHGTEPILVQEFVDGALAMHTVVAHEGRVIDGMTCVAVQSHPEKRSSTVLKPIESAATGDAVRRLVAALGCSGFVSFDFILDAAGQPWLLEMNARPIGSTHLGRLFGHDLAHAFVTGSARRDRPATSEAAVALFPKELERDPSGALADGGHVVHDVPWDEPAVVAAYVDHLARLHPTRAADLRRRFGFARQDVATDVEAVKEPHPQMSA